MKNRLILFLALSLGIISCNKDERQINPGERPDERMAQALKQYKATLTEAEHGWIAILYPGGGAGYSFHFIFSENDRVRMVSDISEETANEEFESTYRIRAMQKPTLIFDTYSYVHILSDPDERKSGGERGQGKYSDFEFEIESTNTDLITFRGKYFKSKLELRKASKSEAENFIKNVSSVAREFENINSFTTYFKRLKLGNRSFDIETDTNLRTLNLTYSQGNQIRTFSTSYYYTEEGVQLLESFNGDNITIHSFKNIQFNSNNNNILLTANEQSGEIERATSPLQINKGAATNLKQSFDYWISITGFTIEGVQDAQNLHDIPNFSFLIFWPNFDTYQGNSYDLLGFVFGNSIHYGIATISTVTNDGRYVNNYLGILGEIDEEDEEILIKVLEKWADPDGFYIVEKNTTIDMVSAKGGTSWMSFF